MSSETISATEHRLRQAFERLKAGRPKQMPTGSLINLSTVAQEAGYKDRSILRKDRFPSLVRDIQAYIELHAQERPTSNRQINIKRRTANRNFKERLEAMKVQRDMAQSLLANANRRLVELAHEISHLQMQLDQLRKSATIKKL